MSIFQAEVENLIQSTALLKSQAEKKRWIREIVPELSPIKLMRLREVLLNAQKYDQAKLDYYQHFYDHIRKANHLVKKFVIQNQEKKEKSS